jgi:hypothetical protein
VEVESKRESTRGKLLANLKSGHVFGRVLLVDNVMEFELVASANMTLGARNHSVTGDDSKPLPSFETR